MTSEKALLSHRERQRRYRVNHTPSRVTPVTPVTPPSPIVSDAPSHPVTVTPPRKLKLTFEEAMVCDYLKSAPPVPVEAVKGKPIVPLTTGAVVYRDDRVYAEGQHVIKTTPGGLSFRLVVSGYDKDGQPVFEGAA